MRRGYSHEVHHRGSSGAGRRQRHVEVTEVMPVVEVDEAWMTAMGEAIANMD